MHESNATLSDELEKAATATKEMRKKLVGMDKTREQTVELNEQVRAKSIVCFSVWRSADVNLTHYRWSG